MRTSGSKARTLVASGACLCVAVAVAPTAEARNPVYRDPPTYRGTAKAPATKPPPQMRPDPVSLSTSGQSERPDVLVDEAGTAHVVWNEARGEDSDATAYCRLKRGARDCDIRATLTGDRPGEDPRSNTDSAGPRIVRLGEQLLILSGRPGRVLAWTSNDGGTTWPGSNEPRTIGRLRLGQLAVIGPQDDPTILSLALDGDCSKPGTAGMCIVAYKSGQFTGEGGDLSADRGQAYNPTLAVGPDGMPVAGFTDADANSFVRRWSGRGSVMDPATWSSAVSFRGDLLSLAGGPGGVYAMSKPGLGAEPFEVRRLAVAADGAVTAGEPTAVSESGDVLLNRLAQDPSGRLLAAWSQRSGTTQGLMLGTSAGGERPAFDAPQRLVEGTANGQIALGAAADGGGFATLNHTCCGFGEIMAAGFGNQAATDEPGIADVPGGGGAASISCQSVRFGKFSVDTSAGCFLQGSGRSKGLVVSGNEIELNGLRIVPDPGVKVVIDPKALRIDTTGAVRVLATAPGAGEVLLWHGQIHRDVSKAVPGANLFEFPAGEFKAEVFGFELAADIPVRLETDGVRIPIDLRLPKAFGGFTGQAELIARRGQGLVLDSLKIHIGPVPLGALVVNSFDLAYTGAGEVWNGSGSVTVPAGGTLDASVRFEMGGFKRATIDYTPTTPTPIGPFVYLLSIGGAFGVDPVSIEAKARFGAGVAVGGESPVKVDGTFAMTFPRSGPAHFKLTGTVSVFFFEAGNGSLEFYTDGYAAFGGQVGPLELGPLRLDARLGGFVDAGSGAFGADFAGKIELCVAIGCGSAAAEAAVNDKGFAICVGLDPLGRIGVRFPWNKFHPAMLANAPLALAALAEHFSPDCNTDEYRTPPPRGLRKAQAGGLTVDVPAGPSETILVKGEGGQPRVSVTGPSGESFNSDQPSAAGHVVYAPGLEAAYVLLKKPAAGAWTIMPMDGSPKFGEVKLGDGYLPATVRAALGGKGQRRTIGYRVSGATNGQTVRFAERGAFGTRLLGAAKSSKGTLRFTPTHARGARRTVIALTEKDGIVVDEVKVGTFTAPAPPKPAAPARLRAQRKDNRVTVTWKFGKGARQQIVRLRGKHMNLARLVSGRARKVVFTAVRRDEPVTIEVRGRSHDLREGPARKVRAGAVRRGRRA